MKDKRTYTAVVEDEGVNYREIADIMTELGFTMNHSSARNHVLRVMDRFVRMFTRLQGISLPEKDIDRIAKSSEFQHGIADVLHIIESKRIND